MHLSKASKGTLVLTFIAGLLFSVGLSISGMTAPNNVIGFLDFFGNWNPSLLGVLGGAAVTNAILFWLTTGKGKKPIFETKFFIPTSTIITKELVIGSALFGIGWGLGGFCPGPALVSFSSLEPSVLVFIISMMVGMYIYPPLMAAIKKEG